MRRPPGVIHIRCWYVPGACRHLPCQGQRPQGTPLPSATPPARPDERPNSGAGWCQSDGSNHFFRTHRKNRREERPDHCSAHRHGSALRETLALHYSPEESATNGPESPSGLRETSALHIDREREQPDRPKGRGKPSLSTEFRERDYRAPTQHGGSRRTECPTLGTALPVHHAPRVTGVAAGVVWQRKRGPHRP